MRPFEQALAAALTDIVDGFARDVGLAPPTLVVEPGRAIAGPGTVTLYEVGVVKDVELAGGVRSMLTLVFYLNDGFEGGATDFPELRRTIEPRRGRALVFQHRVLHEATVVTRGEKLVLRTDVLFRD